MEKKVCFPSLHGFYIYSAFSRKSSKQVLILRPMAHKEIFYPDSVSVMYYLQGKTPY